MESGLELKFAGGRPVMTEGAVIEGYASRFGLPDQGGDIVVKGAFDASLTRLAARGDKVRMLWQHDPAKPIGIWDEIREDDQGLWVRGRLLPEVTLAREAATLIEAGAIEGLSIGYRTIRTEKDGKGHRLLTEIELWEVSLVTFPMLPEARIGRKESGDDTLEFAAALLAAAEALRG
ncbi:MAG: HK97 family phage prohead protease [Paracoccus sp. (in: a-proteobacteria)]